MENCQSKTLHLVFSGNSEDSGASSPVNFESATGIAEALQSKLKNSPAHPHFMSLLQHLFMVPSDERHLPLWRLFDLILQHLTLHATVHGMTDVEEAFTSAIDMEDVLTRLHTQCDYERLEGEMERLKEELDQERMRAMELDNRIADLGDGRNSVVSRISNISSPSDPCPSVSPLPPVCPPAVAPPPPPPPLAMGMTKVEETQKRVPKPTGPLKTFNWLKLNEAKVKGTAWEFIEDEKMYKQVSVIDPRRYQNCTIMLSKLKLTHREIRTALLAMDDKGKLPKDMIEQMLKFVPTLADRYLYEMAQIPRFEPRLRSLYIIRTFQERYDSLMPHIHRDKMAVACFIVSKILPGVIKASTALSSSKKFKQLLALILAIGNYLNYGKRSGNAFGFDLSSLNRLSDVKFSNRSDRNLLHYILQVVDNRFPDLGKLRRELSAVYDAARYNRSDVLAEIRSLEQSISAVRSELAFILEAARNGQTKEETPEDCKKDCFEAVAKHRSDVLAEIRSLEQSISAVRSELAFILEAARDGQTKEETPEDCKKDCFEAVAKQFISSACEQYHVLEKLHSEMKAKLKLSQLQFAAVATQFCFDTVNPEELFGCLAKFLTAFCDAQQQLWIECEHKEQVKRQTLARSYFAKKCKDLIYVNA
ncbi:unnamed protein product [Strongylus vulgaris]|uniref:FH2 domain-containing protein n=1 Tax=Strongylus vulgaris TaxID=40348 RepID=A0A3P7JE01_STRVU|nr:unnamed protein product [Strongylus vulgaris]